MKFLLARLLLMVSLPDFAELDLVDARVICTLQEASSPVLHALTRRLESISMAGNRAMNPATSDKAVYNILATNGLSLA